MNTRAYPVLEDDGILAVEESETPVTAWTLDELDFLSDAVSLRAALGRANDPIA